MIEQISYSLNAFFIYIHCVPVESGLSYYVSPDSTGAQCKWHQGGAGLLLFHCGERSICWEKTLCYTVPQLLTLFSKIFFFVAIFECGNFFEFLSQCALWSVPSLKDTIQPAPSHPEIVLHGTLKTSYVDNNSSYSNGRKRERWRFFFSYIISK